MAECLPAGQLRPKFPRPLMLTTLAAGKFRPLLEFKGNHLALNHVLNKLQQSLIRYHLGEKNSKQLYLMAARGGTVVDSWKILLQKRRLKSGSPKMCEMRNSHQRLLRGFGCRKEKFITAGVSGVNWQSPTQSPHGFRGDSPPFSAISENGW